MALNIKDRESEELAAEVVALTGESKRAVEVALQEREQRLALRIVRRDRAQELRRFLEEEVWPQVPPGRPSPVSESPVGNARRSSATGRRGV